MARMGPRMGPTVGPRMGPNITFGGGTAHLSLLLTAHGLWAGDGPFTLTTTGVLPTGLATATDYYAIVVDTDHLLLAASRADALADTSITLTDAGTGTHTLVTGAAYTATPITFSADFIGDSADGWIQFVAHTLQTGDGPFQLTTTGVLPDPLATATDYWFIDVGSDGYAMLATSYANAIAFTSTGVNDDGTGTHTMASTGDTVRRTYVALGDSTFTVE